MQWQKMPYNFYINYLYREDEWQVHGEETARWEGHTTGAGQLQEGLQLKFSYV